MSRKSPQKIVNFDDEAVQHILAALLAEFRQRGLGMDDLQNGYKGLAPTQLKLDCLAAVAIAEVDYDLAMDSLVGAGLLKTGPIEAYPNHFGSSVLMVGVYSKKAYAYLTSQGYQGAMKLKAAKPERPAMPNIHFTGNTFHGSQIGVGASVSQTCHLAMTNSQQLFEQLREEIGKAVQEDGKRNDILVKLDRLAAAEDKPSKMERYNQFVATLGDHITVLQFMLPALFQWMSS